MGVDISGLNPVVNTERPPYIDYDNATQEEKDAYEKTPFISGERIKKDVTNIFKNYEKNIIKFKFCTMAGYKRTNFYKRVL